MCQGLPMEAFGRISFSACCSRCSRWEPGHCLFELVVSGSHLSPCIATINWSFFTEIPTFFFLTVDSDPEVDSPGAVRTRKIRTLFPRAALMAEVMAVWRLMVLFPSFLRHFPRSSSELSALAFRIFPSLRWANSCWPSRASLHNKTVASRRHRHSAYHRQKQQQ